MIIDAHTHLPPKDGRSFEFQRSQYVADLHKDNVESAILIPDNIVGSGIGDLDTCIGLFAGSHQIHLVGTIDIQTQGQVWLDKLDRLLSQDKIVGMKIFPGHDPIYPTDPRLDPVYSLCVRHRRPMIVHTGWNSGHPEVAAYNDPKYIVEVARRFPDLPLVIAHYFWPSVRYCYDVTRGYPNIYFDTSCLADAEVVAQTGGSIIREVLLTTIEEKPHGVLFGSDYLCCERKAHIDLINDLPILSELKEAVFWKNAWDLFRLPSTSQE